MYVLYIALNHYQIYLHWPETFSSLQIKEEKNIPKINNTNESISGKGKINEQ